MMTAIKRESPFHAGRFNFDNAEGRELFGGVKLKYSGIKALGLEYE